MFSPSPPSSTPSPPSSPSSCQSDGVGGWLCLCGGSAFAAGASQGLGGPAGEVLSHDFPKIFLTFVADYLRETEDILSYEPFLGVADPPQEAGGGSRGVVTSR